MPANDSAGRSDLCPASDQATKALLLNDLKSRIDADAYVVDPILVAQALLRRSPVLLGLPITPAGARTPQAPASPANHAA